MSPEVAEWFAAWWAVWVPFLLLVVGGSVTGVWALVTGRDKERVARKSPLPPTWPEMWARIDAQDKRIDTLEEALAKANRQVKLDARFREDMFAHMVALERLIPVPPGPPPRPSWLSEVGGG